MSIAIATTALKPTPSFLEWSDYHLRRVTIILVYADTKEGHEEFKNIIGDRSIVVFEGSTTDPHLTPESRVVTRQNNNVEHAIRYLLPLGIEWLLHIDLDELLYEPTGSALPSWNNRPEIGHVTFTNHEAMPVTVNTGNLFTDCKYFKINGGNLAFAAYSCGKSAVRLSAGVANDGPHRFLNYKGEHLAISDHEAVLLHYTTPYYEDWVKKFIFYGPFTNNWFNDPARPMGCVGMMKSRDVVQEALKTGDWDKARVFYNERILVGSALDKAIGDGDLRVYEPMK